MSATRKIKKEMVKAITANPHRQKYLIKHSKIKSETDLKKD